MIDTNKNKKIFVTGGCGFIGSNFIRLLLNNTEYNVVNYDALTYAGNLDNLREYENSPRYTFVKGNICDIELVLGSMKGCNIVVNFAAESHVDRSIENANDFIMTNIVGTATLLEAARRVGIKRFIQIGTDEAYGSLTKNDPSSKENYPLKPSSPYSSSKSSADLLALSYYRTYGLPVIITRSSNNYGPYQYPEKLIPLFITNLIEGKKVPLMGKGENVRDWIYVEDNCLGILDVIEKGRAGEIYNIGGESEKTNMEITKRILSAFNKDDSWIAEIPHRLGHDFRYSLDCTKIKSLGWKQRFSFDKAMKETIKWYSDNEEWWKKLKEADKK